VAAPALGADPLAVLSFESFEKGVGQRPIFCL
jgi:hypothetical protein